MKERRKDAAFCIVSRPQKFPQKKELKKRMNSNFVTTQKVVEHAIAAQASTSKTVDDEAN